MQTVRRGSRGTTVNTLQEMLNARGASPRLSTDGIFGSNTNRAVRQFQRTKGLTVDGIVGPNTWTALNAAPAAPTPPPSAPVPAKSKGKSVTLTHAAKYKGDVLGYGRFKGECAAGVQQVFSEASKPLGLTRKWRPGVQVKGNNVAAGTAIASFKNGRYWKHAAVFIRETHTGLEVWDQWAGQPWHKRTLRFNNGNTTDGSNNGNLFYVVTSQ